VGEGKGTESRFYLYPQEIDVTGSSTTRCRSPESALGEMAEGTKGELGVPFDLQPRSGFCARVYFC